MFSFEISEMTNNRIVDALVWVQVGVNKTVDQSQCIKKYHTAYKVMPPSICHVASFLAQKMAKELKSEDLLIFVIKSTLTLDLRPVEFNRNDLRRALLALET